jgi:hypothetical protein
MLSTVMLVTSTIFSFLNQQYATAVICAMCAGFVGGMVVTKLLLDRDKAS